MRFRTLPASTRRLLIAFALAIAIGVGAAGYLFIQLDADRRARLEHLCSVADENRDIWRGVADDIERRNPASADLAALIRKRVERAEQRAPVKCPKESHE